MREINRRRHAEQSEDEAMVTSQEEEPRITLLEELVNMLKDAPPPSSNFAEYNHTGEYVLLKVQDEKCRTGQVMEKEETDDTVVVQLFEALTTVFFRLPAVAKVYNCQPEDIILTLPNPPFVKSKKEDVSTKESESLIAYSFDTLKQISKESISLM